MYAARDKWARKRNLVYFENSLKILWHVQNRLHFKNSKIQKFENLKIWKIFSKALFSSCYSEVLRKLFRQPLLPDLTVGVVSLLAKINPDLLKLLLFELDFLRVFIRGWLFMNIIICSQTIILFGSYVWRKVMLFSVQSFETLQKALRWSRFKLCTCLANAFF